MKNTAAILFRVALLSSLWLFINPSVAAQQVGTCEEARGEALLEAGNVRARIFNNGPLFWRGRQNLYEVPKGSGVNAMFAGHMMLGGLIDGELHMAGSTYGPYEFWPGPLDEAGNPPADCSQYDRIWEINSNDFIHFEEDSTFSINMLNWPWQLGAPVIDGDGNPDNYNLKGGDRPELLGDQTLWWIMNDRGNAHVWSEVDPIGIEVRASAYAFNIPSEIGDITFYRYNILNKNSKPLTDAFLSMWADPDLGNFADDYFGSDSLLHLQYVYNADNQDENGYEELPPAIGYTFLQTPVADIDLIDNDHDGLIDEPNEPAGMYSAIEFSDFNGPVEDPRRGAGIYNNMRGLWADGVPYTVGGYGRDFSNSITRFAYSGDPVTQSYWTLFRPMPNANRPTPSYDIVIIMSSGPFTLAPGESTEFLIALVWAQGINHLDSVRKIKNIVANLQTAPARYLTSGYQPGKLEPPPPEPSFVLGFDQNFPNPFINRTTLRYSLPKTMQVRLTVYDLLGREISVLTEGSQEAGIYTTEFNGTNLPAGIYFARLELDHLQFTKVMIRAE
ncbi:MAG: T9SS type A sorting domain-containing protein [Rhodothermaceae bacterium]|nr:T9SS type A sorting domain-containing protein [Rhodothermaceae bacterium]